MKTNKKRKKKGRKWVHHSGKKEQKNSFWMCIQQLTYCNNYYLHNRIKSKNFFTANRNSKYVTHHDHTRIDRVYLG